MHALLLDHIDFSHDASPVALFRDLSLALPEGWSGVIGPNGCGKTTLLRLATGELSPSRGTVRSPGAAVYCPQPTEHPPSGLDAFAIDFEPDTVRIRDALGVRDDHPFRWGTLSHGERKRLQVAVALWRRPAVLAIDEPTNHLDGAARDAVAWALEGFDGVGLLVSHDRDLLDLLCERCLDLSSDPPALRPGGATAALAALDQERDAQRQERARLAGEIARLGRVVQVRREASDRSAGRKSRRGLAAGDSDGRAKIGLAILTGKDKGAGSALTTARGRLDRAREDLAALRVDKIYTDGIWFPGARARRDRVVDAPAATLPMGERSLLVPPLIVGPTDRIAVTGANGAGKSTLLAWALAHVTLPPERVTVLPQDLPEAEARAALDAVGALARDERGRVLSIVARLGSRAERVLEGGPPSPGEARKVLLALGAVRDAQLIVMDEPTNHLDLPALLAMEEALAGYPGALLLVSHDRRFRERLCIAEWRVADDRPGPGVRRCRWGVRWRRDPAPAGG